MNNAFNRNIGGFIAILPGAVLQNASAGTIYGAAVDRFVHDMPLSCVVHQVAGAISGSPATSSVTTNVQDSADGTNFADYIPPGASTVATTAALAAQNTDNSVAVDLSSARRFIRVATVVAFTGGTSPAALVASNLIIAGETQNPAA